MAEDPRPIDYNNVPAPPPGRPSARNNKHPLLKLRANEALLRRIKNEEVSRNALMTFRNEYGNSALFAAIHDGQMNYVKTLISYGFDVNEPNHFGETPLMKACSVGNTDIIKLLLKEGANVNAESIHGKTALNYIDVKGNKEIKSLLLDAQKGARRIRGTKKRNTSARRASSTRRRGRRRI
jgi:ankyrin repeat protein